MPARPDESPCILCREIIETNRAGLSFPLFGRTVGIEPFYKSETCTVYVCVECCVGIASNRVEFPRNRPLYEVVHGIVKEAVAQCPGFLLDFWNQLRKNMELPRMGIAELTQGEIIPPEKRLKAG